MADKITSEAVEKILETAGHLDIEDQSPNGDKVIQQWRERYTAILKAYDTERNAALIREVEAFKSDIEKVKRLLTSEDKGEG